MGLTFRQRHELRKWSTNGCGDSEGSLKRLVAELFDENATLGDNLLATQKECRALMEEVAALKTQVQQAETLERVKQDYNERLREVEHRHQELLERERQQRMQLLERLQRQQSAASPGAPTFRPAGQWAEPTGKLAEAHRQMMAKQMQEQLQKQQQAFLQRQQAALKNAGKHWVTHDTPSGWE